MAASKLTGGQQTYGVICHIIKSLRLDLRSAPTNRPVDESSFSWYI